MYISVSLAFWTTLRGSVRHLNLVLYFTEVLEIVTTIVTETEIESLITDLPVTISEANHLAIIKLVIGRENEVRKMMIVDDIEMNVIDTERGINTGMINVSCV